MRGRLPVGPSALNRLIGRFDSSPLSHFIGLCYNKSMSRVRTSPIWKINRQDLQELAQSSSTISDMLRYFGMDNKGSNYQTLKKRLSEDNIDYSHIPLGLNANKGIKRSNIIQTPLEEILTKKSTYSRAKLKERLLGGGLLKNLCYVCGIGPEYNGKGLSLVIDHINGISDDNRLSNLRILCPNCHSQTPTFAGRNVKHRTERRNCVSCGKIISKKSTRCRPCSSRMPRRKKIEWPSKDELRARLKTTSYVSLGKELGVSDNAIRKYLARL